jgi:murein L,D-transpeptidase YafK
MAFRAGHKWEGFWKNLREGYQAFEKTKRPPIVGVKNKRYVFFADETAVPEAFRTASAKDPLAPRLISGWQN